MSGVPAPTARRDAYAGPGLASQNLPAPARRPRKPSSTEGGFFFVFLFSNSNDCPCVRFALAWPPSSFFLPIAIMPPRASSSKTTIIAGILAGLLAAGLGAFYLHQQSAPHADNGPAASSQAAQEQNARAVDALMALPEIKAWSAHIEKATGGRAHGAVMETSPETRLVDGVACYQLSFFESTPDAAHRWESFVVTPDGKRILVDDIVTGDLLSLEQWRKDNAPMQRIATQ